MLWRDNFVSLIGAHGWRAWGKHFWKRLSGSAVMQSIIFGDAIRGGASTPSGLLALKRLYGSPAPLQMFVVFSNGCGGFDVWSHGHDDVGSRDCCCSCCCCRGFQSCWWTGRSRRRLRRRRCPLPRIHRVCGACNTSCVAIVAGRVSDDDKAPRSQYGPGGGRALLVLDNGSEDDIRGRVVRRFEGKGDLIVGLLLRLRLRLRVCGSPRLGGAKLDAHGVVARDDALGALVVGHRLEVGCW